MTHAAICQMADLTMSLVEVVDCKIALPACELAASGAGTVYDAGVAQNDRYEQSSIIVILCRYLFPGTTSVPV